MKNPLSLLAAASIAQAALSQAPVIHAVLPLSSTVEQWGKYEAKIDLTASFSNAYDYDDIRVEAVFTDPDGEQARVEGFFMEDFQLNAATGNLTALASGKGFRLRFSPRKIGAWSVAVSCTTAGGTGHFPAQNFECTPPISLKNKGFVRAGQSNFLQFENGEQFIPVGENMAWQNGNPYLDFKNWVGKMADQGGNFLRLWLCHWGLGLEWREGSNGFGGLKKYKQSNAFYLDWLLEHCAERGVYAMLCLNHHGQVSTQVNPNWSENPYNAANGGPCPNTWDFFDNATAKNLHKNRLRYLLARWGHARSLMTWELFNEVNWTDDFEQHRPEIAAWHAEMAAFLKNNDPNSRPVSTSFGDPGSEMADIWANPDLDYTQRHYYLDSPNLESVLAAGARESLAAQDKPVLIGEFGLNGTGSGLAALDPAGIHFHNGLWGGFFGGGLGSGMTWWWDNYVEPANLYGHFSGLSAMTARADFAQKNFRPLAAEVAGAPADLRLDATLDWGGLGDQSIEISGTGAVSPPDFKLGKFLYGSVWNTQFRRPPTFNVDMPQAGKFGIRTGGQLATAPRLTVWLDGLKVLDQSAPQANTDYEVDVPAGQHSLKVDNTGTDWMQIAAYMFSGLGSAVQAYVLQAADGRHAAGWLLHADYNHAFVQANGAPNAISGASLRLDGLAEGAYSLKWFDCLTGALVQTLPLAAQNGTLLAPLPDLLWDLAFTLDETVSGTQDLVEKAVLPMSIFPNPIGAGAALRLQLNLQKPENVQVDLLGAGGLPLQRLFSGQTPPGDSTLAFFLNDDLPAGIYWLRVLAGGLAGVRALSLVKN